MSPINLKLNNRDMIELGLTDIDTIKYDYLNLFSLNLKDVIPNLKKNIDNYRLVLTPKISKNSSHFISVINLGFNIGPNIITDMKIKKEDFGAISSGNRSFSLGKVEDLYIFYKGLNKLEFSKNEYNIDWFLVFKDSCK